VLIIAATHIKLSGEEKKYIDEVYEPLQVVSSNMLWCNVKTADVAAWSRVDVKLDVEGGMHQSFLSLI